MKKPFQFLRYSFWRVLGGGLFRMASFCRRRQARLCGCISCYLTVNGERIARQALEDAFRAEDGKPAIDRRPS